MTEIFYPHTVAQRLDCDEEAFGAVLTRETSFRDTPRRLPRGTKKYIAMLQQDIQRLANSKDENDQKTVKKMNKYFRLYDRPVIDDNIIPVDTIVQWLAQASYMEFTEFSRLNALHNKQATRALNAHQPELGQLVMERTEHFVENGQFPAIALSSMRAAVQKNKEMRVIDTFEASANHSAGSSYEGKVAVANLTSLPMETMLTNPPTEFQQTIYHEFLHCAAYLGNSGFSTLHADDIPLSWGNEMFVEYHACVEPGQLVPAYPAEPLSDYYETEHRLAAQAFQDISPDFVAEAFFSQKGSKVRQALEQKLDHYFATISPPDIEKPLYHFSTAYEESEANNSKEAIAIVNGYYERAGIKD